MSPTRRFVLTFVAVVYFVSWLFHAYARYAGVDNFVAAERVFLWLYVLTPGVLAVLTGLFVLKSQERGPFWRSAAHLAVNPVWYLAAVVIGAVPWFFAAGVVLQDDFALRTVEWIDLAILVVLAYLNELAWRGMVFSRLIYSRSPMASSLFTGVVWGIWYFPLYLGGGDGDFAPFMMFLAVVVISTATSVIYAWLYLNAGRSLVLTGVMHAAVNVGAVLTVGVVMAPETLNTMLAGYCVAAAVFSVIAAVLINRGHVSSIRPRTAVN